MTQPGVMSSASKSVVPSVHLIDVRSYVTEEVARSQGLATVVDGSVIMRADAESQASGRGRDSVRISSKDQWADVSSLHSHLRFRRIRVPG